MTSRILNTLGVPIACEEYGNPHGFPILVQHGLIASIRDGEIFDLLVNAGARVICVARPGYGESAAYKMASIGEWGVLMGVLVRQLNLTTADVLGMSSGAPYGYAIGRHLGKGIRNLFIFSGIPAMYDDGVLAQWPFPVKKDSGLEETKKIVRDLFLSNLMTEDMSRNDTRDSLSNEGFGIALDFSLRAMDWGFTLDQVKQKVFMRHARHDPAVPFITAEMTAGMLPDCTLQAEESDIHFSQETLNAFFRDVIIPQIK